ncbi:MAG: hypothetical protein ABIA63_09490, partial [bacterium]
AEYLVFDIDGRDLHVLNAANGETIKKISVKNNPDYKIETFSEFKNVLAAKFSNNSSMAVISIMAMSKLLEIIVVDYKTEKLLWRFYTDKNLVSHTYPRLFDLDGDSLDELLAGGFVFNHRGELLWKCDSYGSYQDFAAGDIDPEHKGLEVVYAGYWPDWYKKLECRGLDGYIWKLDMPWNSHHSMVADFYPDRPGMEILQRTYGDDKSGGWRHIIVGANNGKGKILDREFVPKVPWLNMSASNGNYPRTIYWRDNKKADIMVIERHVSQPRVAVVDAKEGNMLALVPLQGSTEGGAVAADLAGDGREEIMVWTEGLIIIYANSEKPRKRIPCPWKDRYYRINKQIQNFIYHPF